MQANKLFRWQLYSLENYVIKSSCYLRGFSIENYKQTESI